MILKFTAMKKSLLNCLMVQASYHDHCSPSGSIFCSETCLLTSKTAMVFNITFLYHVAEYRLFSWAKPDLCPYVEDFYIVQLCVAICRPRFISLHGFVISLPVINSYPICILKTCRWPFHVIGFLLWPAQDFNVILILFCETINTCRRSTQRYTVIRDFKIWIFIFLLF